MKSNFQESFDPTKATYLFPPDNQQNFNKTCKFGFLRNNLDVEVFTSLMCNGILNVCQAVKTEENELVSIPINPNLVKETLSYQEMLSDIVLYQMITGEGDRTLTFESCSRDGKLVDLHNCRIFPSGTYSIFDIYDFGPKIGKNEVLNLVFENIRELYDNDFLDQIEVFEGLFITPEENNYINIGWQGFFERMLSKVDEFLERYDNKDGIKLFLRQKAKSANSETMPNSINNKPDVWYEEDIERYNNLIFSLKNIKEVISDKDMKTKAIKHMCLDFDFVKKDFSKHFSATLELGMQLVFIFKEKVMEVLRNF